MKCVAEVTNQQRIPMEDHPKGKIVFFQKGDVHDFEECPDGWRPIETVEDPETGKVTIPTFDFDTAGEDELLEGEFDDKDLRTYLKEKYELKPGNKGREGLVAMLLDARFRDIDNVDL